MKHWLSGLLLLAVVAGCDRKGDEVPPVPPGQSAPVAGSERCRALGGARVLLAEMSLKYEFCRIGSALIEGTTLARAVNHESPRAAAALLADDRSCFHAGGEIIDFQRSGGRKVEVCRFDDGSMLANETLAEGPRAEGNTKLVNAIQ